MENVIYMRVEALKRTEIQIAANLRSLRTYKHQHGHCRPVDPEGRLKRELDLVIVDLTNVIATFESAAQGDEQLARYIGLAERVLRDCKEMLSLLSA